MSATVESAFRLNASDARRTLTSLYGQARRTDRAFRSLGRSVDGVGGARAVARIQSLRTAVGGLGRETERTASKTVTSSNVMKRAVSSLDTHVRIRATRIGNHLRRIDLNSAQFVAESEIIKAEIRSIDDTATRANLGTTFRTWGASAASLTGAIGGGGGGGSPGGRGGLSGAFGRLSSSVGFFGTVAVAALPAVVALTGAVSALIGSLGMAAGGAAVLGGTTLGAGIVGGAGLFGIIKPAINDIRRATEAQRAYNKAVQDYGDRSRQALQAQRRLEDAFAGRGRRGLREVIGGAQGFASRWRGATATGREDFFALLGSGLVTLNRLLPTFARVSNSAMSSAGDAFREAFEDMDSPGFRRFLDVMSRTFNRSIGPFVSGMTSLAAGIGKIAIAASPNTIRMFNSFDRWAGNWNARQSDASRLDARVGRLVDHFRAWAGLLRSTGSLAAAFFGAGAARGLDMVTGITNQLDRWTSWIQNNPAQITSFFDRTVESTEKLVDALGEIGKMLGQIGDALMPMLDGMSQFTSLMGDAGLLAPALAYAGYRSISRGIGLGGRGGRGGGAGGGGATGVAPIPIVGGGGAAGGIRGASGSAMARGQLGYLGARGLGSGRIGALGAGAGGFFSGLRPGVTAGVGAGARALGPFLGVSAALGGISGMDQGLPFAMDNAFSQATFGLYKRPKTGDEHVDEGIQAANSFAGNLRGSLRGQRSEVSRFLRYQTGQQLPRASNESRLTRPIWEVFQRTPPNRTRVEAEIRQLWAIRQQMDRELHQRSVSRSIRMGQEQGYQLQQAFATGLRRNRSPASAMMFVIRNLTREMHRLRPEGQQVLAQSMVDWGREMARQNPKLRKPFRDMLASMRRDWRRTGSELILIGGVVYRGVRQAWENLRVDMMNKNERMLQNTQRTFTQVQRDVIRLLQGMGYSGQQARGIITAAEKGQVNVSNVMSDPSTSPSNLTSAQNQLDSRRSMKARGGRIIGAGRRDNVHLGSNNWGAPGEMVLNANTERRLNSKLAQAGLLTTVAHEVAAETQPHSLSSNVRLPPGVRFTRFRRSDHAKGGRLDSIPDADGALSGLDALAMVLRNRFGLGVTAGRNSHGTYTINGNVSDHSWGGAIDVSNGTNPTPQMDAAHAWLRMTFGSGGPWSESYSGGAIKQMLYRTNIGGNHFNHIHVALNQAIADNAAAVLRIAGGGKMTPAIMAMLAAGGGGMSLGPAPRIRRRKLGGTGARGAMAQRAADIAVRGANRKLAALHRRRMMAGGMGGMGAGIAGLPGGSAFSGPGGVFEATSYGPPWGGIEGTGITSTGVDLPDQVTGQPGPYIVAVDPAVIPYHSKLRIWPNPFGYRGFFQAEDTGGAIRGNRIDFLDMRGREQQNAWGRRNVRVRGGNGGEIIARRPTLLEVGDRQTEAVSIQATRTGGNHSRGEVRLNIERLEINYRGRGDVRDAVMRELTEVAAELRDRSVYSPRDMSN